MLPEPVFALLALWNEFREYPPKVQIGGAIAAVILTFFALGLPLIIRPSKRPPGDEVYNLAELHPGEDETMDDTRDAYISEEDYVYPPGHQPPSQKGNQPPPANYPFREMYD